jgi:hypothetical protein
LKFNFFQQSERFGNGCIFFRHLAILKFPNIFVNDASDLNNAHEFCNTLERMLWHTFRKNTWFIGKFLSKLGCYSVSKVFPPTLIVSELNTSPVLSHLCNRSLNLALIDTEYWMQVSGCLLATIAIISTISSSKPNTKLTSTLLTTHVCPCTRVKGNFVVEHVQSTGFERPRELDMHVTYSIILITLTMIYIT